MAAHGDYRGAPRPLLHHPLRCRHGPQVPGDVTAPFELLLAGAPGDLPAVGEPVSDQAKTSAAAMFDLVPLRGRLASTGSRRRAGRRRGKMAALMQRVGLWQFGSALRKLIRSLAAAGVVAGWEAKGEVRFPRTAP